MNNSVFNFVRKNYFVSYIYLYIFILPWNFFNGQMGVLSSILLIWWLTIGNKKRYFFKLKDILKFIPLVIIIIFFIYSYLSLIWSDNFNDAKEALKFYKYYWILIPVLFTSLRRNEAISALYIFILSLGCYALFSIGIFFNIIEISGNSVSSHNPRGILAYAIVTPYMAIGFLTSLFIFFNNYNGNIKILFLFIAVLCFISLFINNGRAGQLSFFMTLFVLCIVYRKKIFTNIKVIGYMIITVFLSIYLLFSFNKMNRITNSFKEFENLEEKQFAGSWGHRAYMWYAAGDIIKKNPIIGVGIGDNIDKFIEYTKSHPSKAVWLRTFHNQHLDTLTKLGIVGYILLWGSVLSLLYYIKEDKLLFSFGFVFFTITYFDGIGDIILLMKPYNNIFVLVFILLSVAFVNREKSMNIKENNKNY